MSDDELKILDNAIDAHEKNDLLLASALYLQLLEINPHNPDANHNLGLLTVSMGRVEDSIIFLENAINSNPNVHQYWLSLIDTLIKLERNEDARRILLQAIQLGHNKNYFKNIEAYLDTIEYSKLQESPEIVDPSELLIKKIRNLVIRRDFKTAIKKTNKLIKKYPSSIKLLELCAVAYQGLEKNNFSIIALRKALALKPNSLEIMNRLGIFLIEAEKFDEAIELFNKASLIDPNNSVVMFNIGLVFYKKKMPREAIAHFTRAIALDPNFSDAHVNLGLAYAEANELEEAISCIEEGIRISPQKAEFHYNLAHFLKIKGNFENAKKSLKTAILVSPNYAEAHHSLASLTSYKLGDEHLSQLELLKADINLSASNRALINFALGKAYEDINDISKSYQSYVLANNIERSIIKYNLKDDIEFFKKIKNSVKLFDFENIPKIEKQDDLTPIFIIGMPRSGTTLLEQILTSHSLIRSAGEITDLSNFAKIAIEKNQVTAAQLNLFRLSYLKTLKNYSKGAPYVIDKLPHNFRNVALISNLFPNAKIIHSQRDPKAVCWSNFSHRFVTGSLPYSNDLDDTIRFYDLYQDLMAFWDIQIPDKIYHINYEKLVANPIVEIENLLKYVSVPWEDNCLKPHKNADNVRTASQLQVRKKMYKGSSENWKKFQPYLGETFDKLKKVNFH